MIASESNGYRPGRACVAAHRTGIWACQGHDPLFLWLRWVEVSPKRFSLHARYSFYPSKYAASPQVTKVCVPLFLFSRRNKGDPLRLPRKSNRLPTLQDTTDTPDARYVRSFYSVMLIIYRQLSSPDRTRLNPRPMCGRRSIFSTLGSTGGQ